MSLPLDRVSRARRPRSPPLPPIRKSLCSQYWGKPNQPALGNARVRSRLQLQAGARWSNLMCNYRKDVRCLEENRFPSYLFCVFKIMVGIEFGDFRSVSKKAVWKAKTMREPAPRWASPSTSMRGTFRDQISIKRYLQK